jgi:hypothetical protein
MAVVLGKRRNAVHGRGQANPQGAAVVPRSHVAALGKDYGHSLRTAPCCETPQQRWIRNYQIKGLQGSREKQLMAGKIYALQGYTIVLNKVVLITRVFEAEDSEGYQFNVRFTGALRLAPKFPTRHEADLQRSLLIKALNEC